jgi:predicted DCC family thiol-disulfide oxidoreductase YuxK
VIERDATDHFRFAPIQTALAQDLCEQYDMPSDVSTAVLIDEDGAHSRSTAVLRLFLYMGTVWRWMGLAGLLVPVFVRDACYAVFARNRGQIWGAVKRVTGRGDTYMEPYRHRILGLEEPLDPSWGFGSKPSE